MKVEDEESVTDFVCRLMSRDYSTNHLPHASSSLESSHDSSIYWAL